MLVLAMSNIQETNSDHNHIHMCTRLHHIRYILDAIKLARCLPSLGLSVVENFDAAKETKYAIMYVYVCM